MFGCGPASVVRINPFSNCMTVGFLTVFLQFLLLNCFGVIVAPTVLWENIDVLTAAFVQRVVRGFTLYWISFEAFTQKHCKFFLSYYLTTLITVGPVPFLYIYIISTHTSILVVGVCLAGWGNVSPVPAEIQSSGDKMSPTDVGLSNCSI